MNTDLIPLTRTATGEPVPESTPKANWCAMYHYNITFQNDTEDTKVIKAYVHAPTTELKRDEEGEQLLSNENGVIINCENETKYGFFTGNKPFEGTYKDIVYNTWNWLTVTLGPKSQSNGRIMIPFTCIWGTNSSNGLTHIFELVSEVKHSDTFSAGEENNNWFKE